ncbi:MAG TPA: hypothetical protein DCE42_21940 [Myxococcales bacterium]|nr:hypothetical protein [Deltaproteobacteria bacterium]MBU54209.1 hypothetical protein [Deltaproteobacteria bacterium]HAA57442.1 hypothetical protein [Myxococcales bacterium]|tara:strand:+ start:9088 stop:9621 length:534 start_codon:yes stop_codon:yes gene_type:complete
MKCEDVTFEEARVEDAESLIAFMKESLSEPGLFVPLDADEYNADIEKEREKIRSFTQEENSLFLFAKAKGQNIGMIDFRGLQRRALRHVTMLGICVHRDWRGRGVGNALLEHGIRWARENPVVKRIELYTYLRNERAQHLYEKFGFVREGVRRRMVLFEGEYLDDVTMGLWVGEDVR